MAVPKNGCRSSLSLLSPYAITLPGRNHLTFSECSSLIDNSLLEKVYLFYRDPVERFISAINHARTIKLQGFNFLIKRKPHWFKQIDLDGPLNPDLLEQLNNTAQQISPEQLFNDSDIMSAPYFKPQQYWHTDVPPEKLTVLDFKDFENNLKLIARSFGLKGTITVPRINQSNKITTELSVELEVQVKEYYNKDYLIKQNLV